jgi:hypothetical protein
MLKTIAIGTLFAAFICGVAFALHLVVKEIIDRLTDND